MAGHVVPTKLYFAIFGALLLLTGLTTGMAFVDLGKGNTVVALVIACVKASLVILFFMHWKWSTRLVRVVLISALLWLALLLTLTSVDFASRDWTPVPQDWKESLLLRPTTPPADLLLRR